MKSLLVVTIGFLLFAAYPAQADSAGQRGVFDALYLEIKATGCSSAEDPDGNKALSVEAQEKDEMSGCPDRDSGWIDYDIEIVPDAPPPRPLPETEQQR